MGEKIRRTKYLFFLIDDKEILDIESLLKGSINIIAVKRIIGISLLKGKEYAIDLDMLHILFRIPSNKWVASSEIINDLNIDLKVLDDLMEKGMILSDRQDKPLLDLKCKDEQITSDKWNLYAALYHFMTKWHNIKSTMMDLDLDPEKIKELNKGHKEEFEYFTKSRGMPPPAFYSFPNPLEIKHLPLLEQNSILYRTLLNRKTRRIFNQDMPIKLEQLSTILYYVYGVHEYSPLYEEIVGLRKTSPSGGDLHPIEVYPLVINADGLETGLYHYNAKSHSVEMILKLSREKASMLADEFTAYQSFPRNAQVLFIMTARFYRNYWKYVEHPKAYGVILMDAAHLSQTFYLVCTDLGLGPFFTAAINSVNIEEAIGIDGTKEGAIAICGCGTPLSSRIDLTYETLPYSPLKYRG